VEPREVRTRKKESGMSELLLIRFFKDEILRKPTKLVEVIDEDLVELAGKMLACMKFNHGCGLSANQIGVDKKFCVVSFNEQTKDMALVNPEIVEKSKKKKLLYEGCLSAPRIFPPTKRHIEVKVKFQDLKGDDKELILKDLDARIIQHEVDHLNGKMVIDEYR